MASNDAQTPIASAYDDSNSAILQPVFVYSGFRASSTWFWSKLRADAHCLPFYEPFHEAHPALSVDNVMAQRPEEWRSHHPSNAPYMLEYMPLLGKTPGVPLFPVEVRPGEKLIGTLGIDGPLDADVKIYVASLIAAARDQQRIPVLSDSRLMGRSAGFRQGFGGTHILLIRNLFHQWNSYLGQARFGNFFFLKTLFHTLQLASRDDYIDSLARLFPANRLDTFESWVQRDNIDKVFCYFVGIHLYFLLKTRRNADLVIDANLLARQGATYQHEIVGKIHELTGINVDLSDARESTDYPLYPIQSPQDCEILLRAIADRLRRTVHPDKNENAFLGGLLSSLWDEQRRFNMYAGFVPELLQQRETEVIEAHHAQAASAAVHAALADKTRAIAALEHAIAHERETVERLAAEQTVAAERAVQAEQNLAESVGEIADLHAEVNTLANRLRQRDEEADQAWAQLKAARAEADTWAVTASKIEAERAALSDQLAHADGWVFKLAEARTRNERALAAAQTACARAERERDAARMALAREATQQVMVADLQVRLGAAQGELACTKDALMQARLDLGATSALIDEQKLVATHIASLERQLENATAAAQNAAAHQNRQLKALRTENARLAAEAFAQEQQLAAVRARATPPIQNTREEIVDLRRGMAEAVQAAAVAENDAAQATTQAIREREKAAFLRAVGIELRRRCSLLPSAYSEGRIRRGLARLRGRP